MRSTSLAGRILPGVLPLMHVFLTISVVVQNRFREVDRKTVCRKLAERGIAPDRLRD